VRDKVSLVAEAHMEAWDVRRAPAPAAAFSDKKVGHYKEQAQTLAEKSKEEAGAYCQGQKAAAAEQKKSNAKGTHRAIWPTTATTGWCPTTTTTGCCPTTATTGW